ncbi:MAG: hypothetical protein ABSE98_01960 [Acidimicrobiales bacterium]|jgi:hypothetical protein
MNERELAMKVQRAIADAAAEQPGLITIGPIQSTRGWGDILFVRVQAQLRDGPSPEVQEVMEGRFQAAVREALDGDRCSVSVTWNGY